MVIKKQSIKYIAYFDTQSSTVKRNYVTSASNKVEYIVKAIASIGRTVEILSMSQVIENKFDFFMPETKRIADGVTLRVFFSWGGMMSVLRKIRTLWHLCAVFFYMLLYCKRDDTLIVYHSLGYRNIILWAKKLKKFKLILEVEEIYSDVSQMAPKWRDLEFKMFNIADAFIFSNDLLDDMINKQHKPSTIIYGTYQVEPMRVEKFDDGKIHAIYAGTFDPNKGGVQTAIMAAEYLPENYHIHICGFGSPFDVENVKHMIIEVQAKSKATITYDGFKKGEEFIKFLQKCHIGLSTQNPEGKFNDTSFPSKILTYIANGLSVISIRIPVLEKSTITDTLSFYSKATGDSLANAILKCNYKKSQTEILSCLDRNFKNELKVILDD